MKKLLIAALLASASTVAAHAAAPTPCAGKVVFDTVYQKGTNGKFEYFFQIRNTTGTPITVDAAVANFPSGVTLFSPSLPNITLDKYQNKQIRFGTGSNSQINDGMVRKSYDTRVSGSPSVTALNCRQ